MSTSPDLDEVFSTPKRGPDCWRTRYIPDDARAFLEAVEARMAEGLVPTWSVFEDKLNALGLDITSHSLAHHYKGRCRCPKRPK